MKVWITKYALTQGIFEAEAEVFEDTPNMIRTNGGTAGAWYFHGNDWHTSWPKARERAEQMVANALESLEKKRKKLLLMQFPDPLTATEEQ